MCVFMRLRAEIVYREFGYITNKGCSANYTPILPFRRRIPVKKESLALFNIRNVYFPLVHSRINAYVSVDVLDIFSIKCYLI